jgi:hypothetical protein
VTRSRATLAAALAALACEKEEPPTLQERLDGEWLVMEVRCGDQANPPPDGAFTTLTFQASSGTGSTTIIEDAPLASCLQTSEFNVLYEKERITTTETAKSCFPDPCGSGLMARPETCTEPLAAKVRSVAFEGDLALIQAENCGQGPATWVAEKAQQ